MMIHVKKLALAAMITVLCLGLSVTYADLTEGLVGYWSLDEGNGKEIAEGTGKDHVGTFVAGNPKWVDGKFSKGLEFDGLSDVEIPDHDDFHLVEAVSVALWAKPDGAQADWGKFFIKQKSGEYPYSLQYDDGQAIFATVHASARFDTAPKLPTFKEWAHLAFVYAGDGLFLYKNGEEIAKNEQATGDLQQNELSLSIGGRLNSGQDFKGTIDEVYLYNRELSVDEIKRLMEGHEKAFAVAPGGKLAVTWGDLKSR